MIRYILCYVFLLISYVSCDVINELHIYEKTTTILDVNFKEKKENKNGCKFHYWFIDDQPVDKNEYRLKFKAYKEKELEQEFENEDQFINADEQFNNDIQIDILKKILKLKIKQLQECIEKIKQLEDLNLSEFFSFTSDTFANFKEIQDIEKNVINQAKRFIEKPSDKICLSDINLYIDKLTEYPDKLNKFFKNTLNKAIKVCDDTKLLRQLLDLVTE